MNLTFVFWITACYTLVLFALQIVELLTGRAIFNFTALNAGYLALMSVYVGGKEARRWAGTGQRDTVTEGQNDISVSVDPLVPLSPFRLPGEWFVAAWVIFFLTATAMKQFWPDRFFYPDGLNTIALEVLTFYLGSSVSRWLKVRDVEEHEELESELTHEPAQAPVAVPAPSRVSKKRLRYEEKVLNTASKKGSVTRDEVEKLTGLKQTAAAALLSDMVEGGKLRRTGAIGDPTTRYEIAGGTPEPFGNQH